MPCVGRRGCAERFADLLDARYLFAILAHHGTCGECGNDVTDEPRFDDSGRIPVPYCPACFEELWPTGATGPFERGEPQVYPGNGKVDMT